MFFKNLEFEFIDNYYTIYIMYMTSLYNIISAIIQYSIYYDTCIILIRMPNSPVYYTEINTNL